MSTSCCSWRNGQGYVLEVHDDTKQLYFGPSTQTQPTNYQLEWGKGLISFKPSLSCCQSMAVGNRQGLGSPGAEADQRHCRSERSAGEEDQPNLHSLIQNRQQQTGRPARVHHGRGQQMARAMLLDRTEEMVTAQGQDDRPAVAACRHPRQHPGHRRAAVGSLFRDQDDPYAGRERLHHRVRLPAGRPEYYRGRLLMLMQKRIPGIVIGKVVNVQDPQNQGRIQVTFPWLDGGSMQSTWASIIAPFAGDDRGMYFMPEVGDEVAVTFEHGDFDHAYVIGAMWNGVSAPPSPDPRQRMIRSKNGHTIRFVNSTPSGGNMGALIIEDAHGNRVIMTNGVMRLTAQTTLMIEADNHRAHWPPGERVGAVDRVRSRRSITQSEQSCHGHHRHIASCRTDRGAHSAGLHRPVSCRRSMPRRVLRCRSAVNLRAWPISPAAFPPIAR